MRRVGVGLNVVLTTICIDMEKLFRNRNFFFIIFPFLSCYLLAYLFKIIFIFVHNRIVIFCSCCWGCLLFDVCVSIGEIDQAKNSLVFLNFLYFKVANFSCLFIKIETILDIF